MRSNTRRHLIALAMLAGGCADKSHAVVSSQGSPQQADKTDAEVLAATAPDSVDAGAVGAAGRTDAAAPRTGSDVADAAPPPLMSEPSATEALLGHYAMQQHSSTTARALGTTLKTVTTSYMLVDIVERNGEVVWTQRGCRSEIVNDPASTVVSVSDLVPRSTAEMEASLLAARSGDGILWERTIASAALGFHDQNPELDLPADKNDPRVYDQDGDGKPGVTVHVRTQLAFQKVEGDTYNVQRLQSRLSGSFDGVHLKGEVFETSESRVLEATTPALSIEISSTRDGAGDNSVLLVKVAKGLTCDELVQRKDQLF